MLLLSRKNLRYKPIVIYKMSYLTLYDMEFEFLCVKQAQRPSGSRPRLSWPNQQLIQSIRHV
uniref:Uncharacterized protein n=1 Tax=Arundo donax TaxID=35708 RepID=A0A0A8YYX0_ARUDO